VAVTIGAAASPASRLRRESSDGLDVSVTVCFLFVVSMCPIVLCRHDIGHVSAVQWLAANVRYGP
jgi:hypothetical protein